MIPFQEIQSELRNRIPWYLDDWKQGFTQKKVLFSTFFMYFVSLTPAITFGAYLNEQTGGQLGAVEVLLATSVAGGAFALLSGQPLVILGVSGPVSIFTVTVFKLSQTFQLPFIPWYAWIGIWASFLHLLLASLNACLLVKHITRFACEVFGCLIAVIYIASAFQDFISFFQEDSLESALLSLFLGLGTFFFALVLHDARRWVFFNSFIRGMIADSSGVIAVIVFTALQFLPKFNEISIPHLEVAAGFRPTSGRPWLVQFLEVPIWAIFAAIFPGIILTMLLFFDHNVSSLLSQKQNFNLKKGSAFNWDFFVLGLMILICAILGIPVTHGLIPQAPLHVRSLAKIREVRQEHKVKEIWVSVIENRVSNLGQALLIGITLSAPFVFVLGNIPHATLSGLFLFMGFISFQGNQFADRVKYFLTDKTRIKIASPYIETVSLKYIALFTLIQIVLLGVTYGVTWTQAAISFPIFIVLMVPVRTFVLPRIFPLVALKDLDCEEEEGEKEVDLFDPKIEDLQGVNSGANTISGTPGTSSPCNESVPQTEIEEIEEREEREERDQEMFQIRSPDVFNNQSN